MNTDMVMSTQIDKIAPALLKAQKEMGSATKDSKNPFFRSSYADLNAVREASHPALNTQEITVLQTMVQKMTVNGEIRSYVRTLLLHSSGQFIGSDTEVVCAKQNDPQAYGSGVSYARRYGLQSLLSLGTEDDDAESAMGRTNKQWKPEAKKAEPTVEVKASDASHIETPTVLTQAPTNGAATSSFRKPAKAKTETKASSGSDGWEN